MAVPAKKVSRAKRGMRRSHQRARTANLSECPHCSASRLPHHVCPDCGHYRGREVVIIPVEDLDDEQD